MPAPRAVQTRNLRQVVAGNPQARIAQMRTPDRHTKGANGVLKGRSRAGRVILRKSTPLQTKANADRVPMEMSSPRTSIGNSPAASVATKPHAKTAAKGVFDPAPTRLNARGTRPSCDMA